MSPEELKRERARGGVERNKRLTQGNAGDDENGVPVALEPE